MFGAICGLIVTVLVRVLIEYLSRQFTFLEVAVPWFTYLTIGVAAFVGIFMIVKIIQAIVSLIQEKNSGGRRK